MTFNERNNFIESGDVVESLAITQIVLILTIHSNLLKIIRIIVDLHQITGLSAGAQGRPGIREDYPSRIWPLLLGKHLGKILVWLHWGNKPIKFINISSDNPKNLVEDYWTQQVFILFWKSIFFASATRAMNVIWKHWIFELLMFCNIALLLIFFKFKRRSF